MIQFDDSVNARALPDNQANAVYYIDGRYANYAAVKARLPKASLHAITVTGKTGKTIEVCDCESGDLTPAQAEHWVAEQIKLDAPLVIVYADASTWSGGLLTALAHYGDRIKRWVAEYDNKAEVPSGYDGKQYAGNVAGENGGIVDKNIALDSFFTHYAAPKVNSGMSDFAGTVNLANGEPTIHFVHNPSAKCEKEETFTYQVTLTAKPDSHVEYTIKKV